MLTDFKNSFTVGLSKFATYHISYRTLNVSEHNSVKYKKLTIAIFLVYLSQ